MTLETAVRSSSGMVGSSVGAREGSPNHRLSVCAACSHCPRVMSATERESRWSSGCGVVALRRLTPKATPSWLKTLPMGLSWFRKVSSTLL